MSPAWTTTTEAFARWQGTLDRRCWSEPMLRRHFVQAVLDVGTSTGTYALGDSKGPSPEAAARWLERLSAHSTALFPSRGPLGLAPGELRPWCWVCADTHPGWCDDLGALRKQLEPDQRVAHTVPIELDGALVFDPDQPMSWALCLSSNLWLSRVLDVPGCGSWITQGATARAGAVRFNVFLRALQEITRAHGGALWLEEVHPLYQDQIDATGIRTS